MHIEVTADDIRLGERNDPWCCPIARAAKRALGYQVDVSSTTLRPRDTFTYIQLPQVAQEFIYRFDGMDPVYPFTFDLEVPNDL
jgi:hypothetical protein